MKKHKSSPFGDVLLGFLERRKGQVIDDEFLGKYSSFLWRKIVLFELEKFREMAEILNKGRM